MMEQPRVYNTEEELIKWLKYDLKEQRRETAELEEAILGKKIPLKKVEERYLTLNIGMKAEDISDDYTEYIEINFEFNLNDIIYKLFNKFNDGINCIINCNVLIFNKKVYFSGISFNNIIKFMSSKFMDDVDFSNTSFKNEANFSWAIFNNEVDFSHASFDNEVDFSYSTFKNKAYFSEVSFANKVNFSWTKFDNEVDFSITTFKEADFYFSKFYHKADFSGALFDKVIFLDISLYNKDNDNNKIDFSHITINDYLELDNTNIQDETEIIFDNMIFKDNKSYLSIMNIKKEINKLSLKDITIDGRINIQNVEVETVDFKGSVINGGLVNPVNFEVNKFANRESALFLKNEAYARNNIIDALKYKAKEIETHKDDLLKNSKDYKDWGDIISIELSSLYSDNGLNWIKSFLHTILLPTFFFIASYIDYSISIRMYALFIFYVINRLKLKDIVKYISNTILLYLFIFWLLPTLYLCLNIEVINELLKFFIPIDFEQIKNGKFIYYKNDIIEIILRGLSYYLGKIAFWYGSVQTVQSFRKFSKKE